jgi:hypothetical protein
MCWVAGVNFFSHAIEQNLSRHEFFGVMLSFRQKSSIDQKNLGSLATGPADVPERHGEC